MDLVTLEKEHGDLVAQIKATGFAEGVKAENTRIMSVEALTTPASASLIAEKKFDSTLDASSVALLIVKQEKAIIEKEKAAHEKDISGSNGDALNLQTSEQKTGASGSDDTTDEATLLKNMQIGANK